MKEAKKKADTEEMLVTHKPAKAPDPDKDGRNPGGGARARAQEKEEFDMFKKRLGSTAGAAEKREILSEIQRRFGNDKAAQVVKEMRLHEDDDMAPKPKPKGPDKDKA